MSTPAHRFDPTKPSKTDYDREFAAHHSTHPSVASTLSMVNNAGFVGSSPAFTPLSSPSMMHGKSSSSSGMGRNESSDSENLCPTVRMRMPPAKIRIDDDDTTPKREVGETGMGMGIRAPYSPIVIVAPPVVVDRTSPSPNARVRQREREKMSRSSPVEDRDSISPVSDRERGTRSRHTPPSSLKPNLSVIPPPRGVGGGNLRIEDEEKSPLPFSNTTTTIGEEGRGRRRPL